MCRAIVDNLLSGTKAGSKATRNLVFNQKAERSTMNRQKSRSIVENVFSRTKAGFKSILNFEHAIERKKMENQKSKLTFSAILLAFIMGVAVFLGSPLWAAEMVKDPATGEMVTAPNYGGKLTYPLATDPLNIDPYAWVYAGMVVGPVNEKLGIADWAVPRDEFDFRSLYIPDHLLKGRLAESWETPDPTTIIFHIRQGVHWHDKAPMNGRELTAKDIEYTFHRLLGLGSGFTEKFPQWSDLWEPIESVEATDNWTVVFKLNRVSLTMLKIILTKEHAAIVAPEVIKEHGNAEDWRNVVGTGPYELTDHVPGSSWSYTKNPDYWGTDEKFPENRLPYVDELKMLFMLEPATRLAALRSAKVDMLSNVSYSSITSIDQAESLQRTNPEIELYPWSMRAQTALHADVQRKPWSDIRVRIALQMAIDRETLNATYFKGWADTRPEGSNGRAFVGYSNPYETWPEELKEEFAYNPKRAEELLDEAGYPRGADGIRFKTTYQHLEGYDLDYYQLVMSYLREIGIETEITVHDNPSHMALWREHTYEGLINGNTGQEWFPPEQPKWFYSTFWNNKSNVKDPVYDAMVDAFLAATTIEEQKRYFREADMHVIKNHYVIAGPRPPMFNAVQPWVIGYNGENDLGTTEGPVIFSRLWIDSELKKEMGH